MNVLLVAVAAPNTRELSAARELQWFETSSPPPPYRDDKQFYFNELTGVFGRSADVYERLGRSSAPRQRRELGQAELPQGQRGGPRVRGR